MSEIKVGDTIKRIAGVHCGMKVGDIGTVTYFGNGINLKEFKGLHDEANFELFTQQKTVADAYEAHPLGWDSINDSYGGSPVGEGLVLWDKKCNQFEKGCEGFCEQIFDLVCTRSELEYYAKEQEAEKWTHEYHGDNCKIVHQEKWQAWIVSEKGLSKLVHISELRKQKSALTKEQAWDYAVDSGLTAKEIEKIHNVE